MNKKAQFYLIAALVIISVISGIFTIYNIATAPSQETLFYSLQEEVEYEGGKVISHGLYNSLSTEAIAKNVESVTDYYSSAHPRTDFLIILGDEASLDFILYKNIQTGNLGVKYGNIPIFSPSNEKGKFLKENVNRNGDSVTVTLDEGKITKEYTLRKNENYFFFVIREENREEIFLEPPIEKSSPLERILALRN